MPISHTATAIAWLACLGMFAVAYVHVFRLGTLVSFSFWTFVAAAVVLFASPTPAGYAIHDAEGRHGIAALGLFGPHLAGVLLTISMTALLCACGFRRTPSAMSQAPDRRVS